LDKLRAWIARLDRPAVLLSGNHDPDISSLAELSLRDDRVWVTHGDVLFNDIAPWSRHATEIARRIAGFSKDLPPADLGRVETRLRLNRLAASIPIEPPGSATNHPLARVRHLAEILFPPTRALAMLRAWRDTPRLAAELARAQRPCARVLVLGHTHFPGVWTRKFPGPASSATRITIINTGSFSRPFGAAFAELDGERVRLVRVVRRGATLRPGRVLADFAL
jgi:predicted phosphodiesterase